MRARRGFGRCTGAEPPKTFRHCRRRPAKSSAARLETASLIAHFRAAMSASPAAALASLYTYESRVPAIARTKAKGLREHYDTTEFAARYFTLHQTADVYHAKVWRDAIESELMTHPDDAEGALDAAEATAAALWNALTGIERERQQARAVAA